MSEMIDEGLNLSVLDVTTQAEIDAYLGVMRRTHGPLYEMTSNALWLDDHRTSSNSTAAGRASSAA